MKIFHSNLHMYIIFFFFVQSCATFRLPGQVPEIFLVSFREVVCHCLFPTSENVSGPRSASWLRAQCRIRTQAFPFSNEHMALSHGLMKPHIFTPPTLKTWCPTFQIFERYFEILVPFPNLFLFFTVIWVEWNYLGIFMNNQNSFLYTLYFAPQKADIT